MHLLCGQGQRVYPRACGGTECLAVYIRSIPGLSPRLRGNHAGVGLPEVHHGSIPAPAGEPLILDLAGISHEGLSPRLRGNREALEALADMTRSIPAPAGEPHIPEGAEKTAGVYPRACGGTTPVLCRCSG